MAEIRHSARGVVPASFPLVEHSFLTLAAGLRWHVQQMGNGPDIVLIHGTGGAVHSFRDLMPILAKDHRVTAMDLPGHGFTRKPGTERLSLPAMSEAVSILLRQLSIVPKAVAGHSAGAPILAQMCLDDRIAPKQLFAFNGAFRPFTGVEGKTYGRLARALVLNPVVPYLAAFRFKTSKMVEVMIERTGSKIDQRGLEAYREVTGRASHVASALGMMSRWELQPLWERLNELTTQLVLITGNLDRTIEPAVSAEVAGIVAGAEHLKLEGLGHLAHEEAPERVAALMRERIWP